MCGTRAVWGLEKKKKTVDDGCVRQNRETLQPRLVFSREQSQTCTHAALAVFSLPCCFFRAVLDGGFSYFYTVHHGPLDVLGSRSLPATAALRPMYMWTVQGSFGYIFAQLELLGSHTWSRSYCDSSKTGQRAAGNGT